ncbi:HRDC domain-containing protein [Haliscomenobacter sp.]|uniref:HRDC domain-containing protein n=1 Tax=Haliscomenobacter sp. TaxID=2717303 RepID=UPI003364B468
MQIKIFNIPVTGGEMLQEELNVFLRSKKILQIEDQILGEGQTASWCFRIKYLEDQTAGEKERAKVDYRQVLDEASFQRYNKMREIRRKVSQDEAIPAYVIFTDEELSALAKIENLTASSMKTVKGIADKKIEKFGVHFFTSAANESTP